MVAGLLKQVTFKTGPTTYQNRAKICYFLTNSLLFNQRWLVKAKIVVNIIKAAVKGQSCQIFYQIKESRSDICRYIGTNARACNMPLCRHAALCPLKLTWEPRPCNNTVT